jgi:demethylmenaquinone methyltransferase/2-methoxy-6-polyprenyl-1,4-benzoquinol methylase
MQRLDPRRKSGAEVRAMFDAIAPRYDLLNRLLSAGSDVRWRRSAVDAALAGRERAVDADACCGTGDLALELACDTRARHVVGFDFAPAMVRRAREKVVKGRGSRAAFAVGDALALPARGGAFDVVTVAFGLRNLVAPAAGIAELARLLAPGGRLVVLEFFAPRRGVGGALFRAYFRHVLPRIGRLVAGGTAVDAYRYLPESVEAFASDDEVAAWFDAAGLGGVTREKFLFGAVGLVSGVKRAAVARPVVRTAEPCVA